MKETHSESEFITCKNCESEFVGNFCPHCGQSTKDYEKPFGFLIYDLMGNIFAFDTRLWKTLIAVLFQPGKMAKEFVVGRRVRYMPPFRFYVFVSFIFFLMLSYVTQDNIGKENSVVKLHPGLPDSTQFGMSFFVDTTYMLGSKEAKLKYADKLEKVKQAKDDNGEEEKWKEIQKHPEYFIPQLIKYFSWMLFLIMPVYGSLLWLFFHKKHKYYLGHLIFSINQHSFLFVIFIVLMIISFVFPDKSSSYEAWLLVLAPVYSVIGARKLYQRKWLTTIMRLMAISILYGILLLTGVVIAAVITFV